MFVKRLIFGCFIGLLAVSSSFGAAKYVRSGATGTGTGADWTNAYTALPTSPTRGDTIWIADGTYSNYTFNVATSGSTYIRFIKATSDAHGTGTGWSSTYGDGAAIWTSVKIGLSTGYVDFDGVTGGGPGSWTTGFGFQFTAPALLGAYNFVALGSSNGQGDISHVYFRHASFTQTGNVDIYRTGWTGFEGSEGQKTYCTFEYLYFNNLGGLPFWTRYGNNNLVQYCYAGHYGGMWYADPDQHAEFMVLGPMDNTTIRYNYIDESPGSGAIVVNNWGGSADSCYVYGNIIRQTEQGAITFNGPVSNWKIFNNTFLVGTDQSNDFSVLSGDAARSNVYFYNNILYQRAARSPNEYGNVTHDYNWWSDNASLQCDMDAQAHENITNSGGCDALMTSEDPFVSSGSTTPENLALSDSLPGWAGYDVCQIQSCANDRLFNYDMFGNLRGADGIWDRGAIEFTGTPVTPPSGTKDCYYIDYVGGSDANAGTSKATPWKRCPGMVGFAGSYTHAAGDSFVFKGGVTWVYTTLPLTIGGSGVAGSVDCYTTDHTWYTGASWSQPIFDGDLQSRELLACSGKSYFKINDIKFIDAGSLSSNSFYATLLYSASNMEISNCTFASESWGTLYISPTSSGNYRNILIHHNDFSSCAWAIRIVPAAANAIINTMYIYNNTFHDFSSQIMGAKHVDAIQYYNSPDDITSSDRYIDTLDIYNNTFTGDFSKSDASQAAGTAFIYMTGYTSGTRIFNNLFAPDSVAVQSPVSMGSFIRFGDWNASGGGYHKVYNNTFIGYTGGQNNAICDTDEVWGLSSRYLTIKNNIFKGFDKIYELGSNTHTINYNDYVFNDSMGQFGAGAYLTFNAWKTGSGQDASSISADPGFVSDTNFHLGAASPCISIGENLSTVFTTDIEGLLRPSVAAFSLGAYEYSGVVDTTQGTYDSLIICGYYKQAGPIHANMIRISCSDSCIFTDSVIVRDSIIYGATCIPKAEGAAAKVYSHTSTYPLTIKLNLKTTTPYVVNRYKIRWR